MVLGRNGGMVQQLFAPFYLGVGGPVGHGNQPMPWIHVVDAVGLFEHSLATPSVQGVVNGVAPHIITNRCVRLVIVVFLYELYFYLVFFKTR